MDLLDSLSSMSGAELVEKHRNLTEGRFNPNEYFESVNIGLLKHPKNRRPFSISVEDLFFGDSGKGAVIAKINRRMKRLSGSVFSLRYNGGSNAGHETKIDGIEVATHQLPTGVLEEGVMGIMLRGQVIHPQDLVTEIKVVEKAFGKVPGKLKIDDNTPLALDTHRAKEAVDKCFFEGTNGATGSGIADAYADFYKRQDLTIFDLMSEDWEEVFLKHYRYYQRQLTGFDVELSEVRIPVLTPDGTRNTRRVGTEVEFIERLAENRNHLRKFVHPRLDRLLQEIWRNPQNAVTLEGAQGTGLDPWHGVRPDITASRPMSSNIIDATYGVVQPDAIALRAAVMKTTYMSSVGTRVLPTTLSEEDRSWIQHDFNEVGKSTGRKRGIYEVSMPMADYFKKVAGFDFLIPTHLDASKPDIPVRVITHYTDPGGKERPYSPYQRHLNKLTPYAVEFPGWDGNAVKKVRDFHQLPEETLRYLAFISCVAPIVMVTHGPDINEYLSLVQRF